jgi:serine/threonine protein kinase
MHACMHADVYGGNVVWGAVNRAKRNPALKVAGVKAFTFEELAQATDNFSDEKQVGQGGYGKVYLGNLNDGKKQVAIKRAEEGSLQGAHEFYTEIELLSRVHHRNLVMLEGYCDDEGEQVSVQFLLTFPVTFLCLFWSMN